MDNIVVICRSEALAIEAAKLMLEIPKFKDVRKNGFSVYGSIASTRSPCREITLDELRDMAKKADLLTDVAAFTAFRDGKAIQCRRTEFDNWQDVRPDVLASVFTGESTFFRLKPIKTIRIGNKEVAAPVSVRNVGPTLAASHHVDFCGQDLEFATVDEAVEFSKAILNEVNKNV